MMVSTALWDYNDIVQTVSEEATTHVLRPGTVAFLLAALQIMEDRWRWEQYYDDVDYDKIQAYIGQATEDIMVEGLDCADIIACIGASGGGGTPQSGGNGSAPIALSAREQGLLPDDWQCDKDHAFGMSRGLVEALHGAITDILQKFEVETNPIELAAEAADNFPVISWGSSALDVISWMQDSLKEEYDAAYNDVIRDEFACDLHCIALENCNLTFVQIFQYYVDATLQTPPDPENSTWDDWALWFIGLAFTSFTDRQTVAIGQLVGLVAMHFGSKAGAPMPSGIRTLGLTMKLLANETSPDWEILCDDCPEGTWERLFEWDESGGDPLGWVVGSSSNSTIDSEGWLSGDSDVGSEKRRICGINTGGWTLPETIFTFAQVTFKNVGGNRDLYRLYFVDGLLQTENVRGDEIVKTWEGNKLNSTVSIAVQVDGRSTYGALTGEGRIFKALFKGIGEDPFPE